MLHQEDLMIINLYVPNKKTPKYIKENKELKGEIHNSTIIAEEFNNRHSVMNETPTEK